jgi:hypothetical protein
MAATTTLLGLVTPTQGTLSGTWGDTVNYGISDYVDIAIAGTLSFAGDGAITLANTLGSASGNNIGSTTAQYMVIRVTGTLTTPKIITGPSYSKLYMVDNAATGSTVSFIRAGQTPAVSIAVGEKAFVYYNGTDYVKVASSTADGVTTISFGSTGLTPSTATSGAVTVAGTLAIANGGTGTTSTTFANLTTNVTGTLPTANGGTNLTSFTANGVVYASSSSALATGSALAFDGSTLAVTGVQTITNSSGSTLVLNRTSNPGSLQLDYNGTQTGQLQAVSGGGIAFFRGSSPTEGMRLDNAGYLSGVWADEVSAIGGVSSTATITCTNGNVFTATLNGSTTFTLSAPSTTTANTATSFTLILTNGSGGPYTVAWAGGTFNFPGGAAALTRTTTAGATDIWFFFSPNGGTTWYGSIPMANLTT